MNEEIVYEDETMKVVGYPNLNRITVECKSEKIYKRYHKVFGILPNFPQLFLSMTEDPQNEK